MPLLTFYYLNSLKHSIPSDSDRKVMCLSKGKWCAEYKFRQWRDTLMLCRHVPGDFKFMYLTFNVFYCKAIGFYSRKSTQFRLIEFHLLYLSIDKVCPFKVPDFGSHEQTVRASCWQGPEVRNHYPEYPARSIWPKKTKNTQSSQLCERLIRVNKVNVCEIHVL